MSTNPQDLFTKPHPRAREAAPETVSISLSGRFAPPRLNLNILHGDNAMDVLGRQGTPNSQQEAIPVAAHVNVPDTYAASERQVPLSPLPGLPSCPPPRPSTTPSVPGNDRPSAPCSCPRPQYDKRGSVSSVDMDQEDAWDTYSRSTFALSSARLSASSVSSSEEIPPYTFPPPPRREPGPVLDASPGTSGRTDAWRLAYLAQLRRHMSLPADEPEAAPSYSFPPLQTEVEVQEQEGANETPVSRLRSTSIVQSALSDSTGDESHASDMQVGEARRSRSEQSVRVKVQDDTSDIELRSERSSSPEVPLVTSRVVQVKRSTPSSPTSFKKSASPGVPDYADSDSGESEISPRSSPALLPEDGIKEDDEEASYIRIARSPTPVEVPPPASALRPGKRARPSVKARVLALYQKEKPEEKKRARQRVGKRVNKDGKRDRRRSEAEINLCLYPPPPDLPCQVEGCGEIINGTHRLLVRAHFREHYRCTLSGFTKVECMWGECRAVIAMHDVVDHVRKAHLECWYICPMNVEKPGSCDWRGTRDHTHIPQHVKRVHPDLPWPPLRLEELEREPSHAASPARRAASGA